MSPKVRYQLSAQKSYDYSDNILQNVSYGLSVNFTADVVDPEAAGLIPYYSSTIGSNDGFFQNLINNNFKFSSSNIEVPMGTDKDNIFSSWTETYSKINKENDIYDLQISVNVPVWRLRFWDFIDIEDIGESRRLRQAYGYTPLTGSISGKVKNDPGHWKYWLQNYDAEKTVIENASTTEGFQDGERIWTVNLNWKTHDLSRIPSVKEIWN